MDELEKQIVAAVERGDLDSATVLVDSRDRSIDAEPIVVDEESLLTLASMGFELEACNVALAVYKDRDTAMEMMLGGAPPYSIDVGGVHYDVDLGRGALSDRAAGSAVAKCLRAAALSGNMERVQWALAMVKNHPEMRCTMEIGSEWGAVRCQIPVPDAPAGDMEASGARGTPIMIAVQENHIDVVNALAMFKADVDICDCYGSRAMHNAASTGKLHMLKILLAEGADLERPNKLSFSPLHVAIQNKRANAADMLLARKADPASTTNTMSTSLHLAAREGSRELCEVLLKHRADVDAKGLENATPLHFALAQGHGDVVELLLTKGASLAGTLQKAASHGKEAMVEDLLNRRADVNERDGEGRTVLHLAVKWPGIVKQLVLAKTPMTPDVCGRTPLHEAARQGTAEVAAAMLAAGADRECKDSDGRTALDLAKAQLSQVWEHETQEGKSTDWFEWAHDQFGVSMANVAKDRDIPALVKVLETA